MDYNFTLSTPGWLGGASTILFFLSRANQPQVPPLRETSGFVTAFVTLLRLSTRHVSLFCVGMSGHSEYILILKFGCFIPNLEFFRKLNFCQKKYQNRDLTNYLGWQPALAPPLWLSSVGGTIRGAHNFL